MDPMLALALPGGALAFAGIAFGLQRLSMRSFERKHPHLRRGADGAVPAQAPNKAAPGVAARLGSGEDVWVELATLSRKPPSPDAPAAVVPKPSAGVAFKRYGYPLAGTSPMIPQGKVRSHSNILPPRASPPPLHDEDAAAKGE